MKTPENTLKLVPTEPTRRTGFAKTMLEESLGERLKISEIYRRQAESALEGHKANIRAVCLKVFSDIEPDAEWRPWARRVLGHLAVGDVRAANASLKNRAVVGACANCGINLHGKERAPQPCVMPCSIIGCPFEKPEDQDAIEETDLLSLIEARAR